MSCRLSLFFAPGLLAMLPWTVSAGPSNVMREEPHQPTRSAGWPAPGAHSHFSPLGTPLVHSFRLEPPFTHRDWFVDLGFRQEDEGDELEIATELEWALTDRLGLVIEAPYRFLDPDDGSSVDGWGDLAVAPRLLMLRSDRFLLAGSFEVEIPTGDDDRGLGEGEVAFAPSVSTWWDLGDWWSLSTQVGVEHVLEPGETEFFFRASLVHTFGRHRAGHAHEHEQEGEGDHAHGLKGLLSMILEIDGAVPISGEESEDVALEGIAGLAYGFTDSLDLRMAFHFPLTSDTSLDRGLTLGAIWHF